MNTDRTDNNELINALQELRRKNSELEKTIETLRKAERRVKENELRYQTLFESSAESISLLKDQVLVDCNEATCVQFACDREDMIGNTPLQFSPPFQPDGRPSTEVVKEKIERVLAGETLFFTWRHIRKNGELFDAEVSLKRIEIDGEPYVQATNRDISERVRAESAIREEKEKLRLSEERFRAIFDNAPIGLMHVNRFGHPEITNEALRKITGYTHEELSKITYLDLSHPDDRAVSMEYFEKMFKGELDRYHLEKRYIHKSGDELWINAHTALIRDKEGRPETVIGMIEDITSRKQAERKLHNALHELEQLKQQLEKENEYLVEEINLTHNFGEIIGRSNKLKKLLKQIEQVASSESTVLILGETGTGKEMFARAIHNLSPRKQRPMIKVNCAALPANLIESELFGHEKGAFTGAVSRKIGKFELADRGTIFLDEVGDLPFDLQAKLLRVLQENEFERLGGTTTIKADVRVLAATNKDLEEMKDNGEFREDLFFRLNVFPLDCPPLRERKDDIPMLTRHFLEKYSAKNGKRITRISEKATKTLQSYDWPGNVRELENIIERAVVLSSTDELQLGSWFVKSIETGRSKDLKTLDQVQADYITHVLEKTNGRIEGKNGAAGILGVKPPTLRSRMQKLGVKVEKKIREIS